MEETVFNKKYGRVIPVAKRRCIMESAMLLTALVFSFLILYPEGVNFLNTYVLSRIRLSIVLVLTGLALAVAAAVFLFLKTRFLLIVKRPGFFALGLFAVSFALKAVFIFAVPTEQTSDFKLLYYVTNEITNDIRRYTEQSYFKVWAYQTGFPAIMSLFTRAAGVNIRLLLFANAAFFALSNVFVFYTARLFTGEKAARTASLGYMLYPFSFSIATVYTNQHLANLCFTAGVYLFFRKDRLRWLFIPLAGLVLALGDVARPEGILPVCALIVLTVICFFKERKLPSYNVRHFLKNRLLPTLIAAVIYFGATSAASWVFVKTGLNPYGLENNFPLYKFSTGLNHATDGVYSQSDVTLLFDSEPYKDNYELRDAKAKELILQRLFVSPQQLFKLFENKIKVLWVGNHHYLAFYQLENSQFQLGPLAVSAKDFITFFGYMDAIFSLLVYGLCAGSFLLLFRKQELRTKVPLFYTLLFCGIFIVYLFIEVQSRYVYLAVPALFILASQCLDSISIKLSGMPRKTVSSLEKSQEGV